MKKFILNAMCVLAAAMAFTSCDKSEEPDNTVTYGGKDSDGDYVTLVVNEEAKTYDLYYGESKKDENYQAFSNGTYVLESSLSGDSNMKCADADGVTTFTIIISKDGNKASYSVEDDPETEENEAYSFELKKK